MTQTWRLLTGDVRERLTELPDASVQCCVTSPPYWGLRDYGTEGQIGLEATPDAYAQTMVEVFREVKRVLKDDGTLWLNLGSSMASDPKKGGSGTFNGRNGRGESYGRPAIQSLRPSRVPAYDNDGRALEDSQVPDSVDCDLCDGCRAARETRTESSVRRRGTSGHDVSTTICEGERLDSVRAPDAVSLRAAPESTSPLSSEPRQAACSHCANCGACLSVLRSTSRDARLCARRVGCMTGSELLASDDRNQGMDASGTAWLKYTMFKPKDLVPIPWMVAMALQADGWYLRSDIIWSKPNPMPESVTDRPTKAHEYIFLLSKKASYYYDAEAIKEQGIIAAGTKAAKGSAERFNTPGVNSRPPEYKQYTGTRNCRSVWQITTQPYPGAHFATFPEALPERCITAGTKLGDTVLDPFAGSGTTGQVAIRLGRSFLGIELNPEYAGLARTRIGGAAPLFAQEIHDHVCV
jgi:DNA modification methylase